MEFFVGNKLGPLFLVLILTLLGCTKVTIQSNTSKKYMRCAADSIIFNAIFFISVSVLLALFFPLSEPDPTLILVSMIAGLLTVSFQTLYSISFSIGPVSLTSLMINFSMLISTSVSVVFFREKLYFSQFIGILFLIASIILSHVKTEGEKKGSKSWMILTIVTLIINGFASCAQKAFYMTESSKVENSENTMIVFMYLFAAIFAVTVYFIGTHTGKKEKTTFGKKKQPYLFGLSVGVVMTVYQKFYMFAMENVDGTFFFPTSNGMQALVMTLIGVLVFKDSLTVKQRISVVCGLVCIILMNFKLGPSTSF